MPNQYFSPEGDLENYFITEYWLIDQYVGDTLWSWGGNTQGQLGDNTTTTRSIPVTTSTGGTNWKQVSALVSTTAIKIDGTLWVWGDNSYRQLGINNSTTIITPVTTFAGGNNWKQVSAGGRHTAAIKTDGTLWTCGANTNMQLGINGIFGSICTPVTTFAGGTNWKQVSVGEVHTAAIKTDGTLWTWGPGVLLGINDGTNTRSTPVTTFLGGTNWKQVDCSGGIMYGGSCTAAIKTDGTLWIWGFNSQGQLGSNDTTDRLTPITTFAGGTNWKQVNCESGYVAAIKTDGTLWTWGRNLTGQLGINNTNARTTPVTTFAGGTNWKQVSCGYNHTAAIKTDGTLWNWGGNGAGQLGINNTNARSTPVTAFVGGNNWKQVAAGSNCTISVTSGTDPTFFIS